jgi:hypothetical protein
MDSHQRIPFKRVWSSSPPYLKDRPLDHLRHLWELMKEIPRSADKRLFFLCLRSVVMPSSTDFKISLVGRKFLAYSAFLDPPQSTLCTLRLGHKCEHTTQDSIWLSGWRSIGPNFSVSTTGRLDKVQPYGLAKDVVMEIHGSLTLVDFLVVNVDLRQQTSIILEAPFLEFIMEKSMRKRESSTSGSKENKKSSPFSPNIRHIYTRFESIIRRDRTRLNMWRCCQMCQNA